MNWRAPWLKDRYIPLALAICDIVVINTAYAIVAKYRTGSSEAPGNGAAFAICCWIFISYILGRYSQGRGEKSANPALRAVVQSIGASTAVVVSFITHSWLYQVVDAQTRLRGFLLPALAIVGACGVATKLITSRWESKTKSARWTLICSPKEKGVLESDLSESELKATRLCSIEEFKERQEFSDNENIAIGGDINPRLVDGFYFARIRAEGRKVVNLTEWCELKLQRIPSELIDAQWFLLSEGFAIQPGRVWWRIKRLGDIVVACVIALFSAPLVLAACLAIWAEDRGPLLYRQKRTGIYGAQMEIWKLRSMRTNAEEDGARWATKSDPRITRVGKLIRKTRVDELPQLWNVIKGDLSLIGPRPERPEIERELERCIANYRTREWIRPGLSGWAQVSFPYGASVADSKMKLSYDLYYLKNAGLLMDILILLKTIRLVARAEGSSPN